VKTARRPRRRWPVRAILAWGIAYGVAGGLQVWLHQQRTEMGYELAAMHDVAGKLSAERSELEGELATLTSPRSLETAARTRFGMHPPREGQIVGLP
jgi:cell division protein FtsB